MVFTSEQPEPTTNR